MNATGASTPDPHRELPPLLPQMRRKPTTYRAHRASSALAQLGRLRRTEGLVLRVGTANTEPGSAQRLARKIVSDNLRGKWQITMMGENSRDFLVSKRAPHANPTPPQAFDLAYRLRDLRDVEDCEPALVTPANGPAEKQRELASARAISIDASETPSECANSKLWALDLCQVRQAWNLPLPAGGKRQGERAILAHLDTGYTDHPEIATPRLLKSRGFDFENDDDDPRDTLDGFSGGHGTSTSSVIISDDAIPEGVVGVAPRAELVPIRVTTSVVLLSFGKLARAIRFATDLDLHVISISLGGPVYMRFLERAVRQAIDRGIVVVCAAGNVWPFVVYPARLDEAIAVAACDCDGAVWSKSASGSAVDITAPGHSVWRALSDEAGFSISPSSGTSYSTAITAGAAALWIAHHGRDKLIAKYGRINLAGVFKELLLTQGVTRPQGWDRTRYGAGILNARKLLAASLPSTPPAGGMHSLHAAQAPRDTNQVDRVLELFPSEDSDRVRTSLTRLLGVNAGELNASLRDVGQEIEYLAATETEFRQMLCRPRRASAATATHAAIRKPWQRASRRLTVMIEKNT